jgi:hypothetical protein
MPKYFLLTSGDQYYPESGDGDWKGFYETYEEAESQVTRDSVKYIINDCYYDWYYIIDLTHLIN